MSVYIRNQPCELLAHVRQAAPPFEDQQGGNLVGIDYRNFEGDGAINERLTREQATALRDALHIFLTRGTEITIAKHNGKLISEER